MIGSAVALLLMGVRFSLEAVDNLKLVNQPALGDTPGTAVVATVSALDYLRFGTHAAITIAFVLFCYGLLQAGERMALPAQWIRSSKDLKLLLGLKAPIQTTGEQLRKSLKEVVELVKDLNLRAPKD